MVLADKEASMVITNVIEIFDNDEFVSIVTKTGSVVHLPSGNHSISIVPMCESLPENERDYASTSFNVHVDFYNE